MNFRQRLALAFILLAPFATHAAASNYRPAKPGVSPKVQAPSSGNPVFTILDRLRRRLLDTPTPPPPPPPPSDPDCLECDGRGHNPVGG